MLTLNLRYQTLKRGEDGYNRWEVLTRREVLSPVETALLLCDVWNEHWSMGATARLNAMVPRMNEVVKACRAMGIQIIHAPSETMDFYEGTSARQRILQAPLIEPPPPRDFPDLPLPIDDTDGGSDTGETAWYKAWTRQHPMIQIDQEQDVISDEGRQIYSFLHQKGIKNLLIMGVHTNMCVLNRSFGIKQMVRWGLNVVLIRDLTDTMYNPALPPYVSHEEGTRLVVEYIEKFWCPTVESKELVK